MKLDDKVIVFFNPDYPWVGKVIGINEFDYLVEDMYPEKDEMKGQNWFPHENVLSYEDGLVRLKLYSDLLERLTHE